MPVARIARLLHWAALGLIYGILYVKAFFAFSPTFDFLWYHLPRGLNFFHLTTYTPSSNLLERFRGFPALAEWVQGLLVFLTGRLSASNAAGAVAFAIALLSIMILFGRTFPLRWFLTFCLALPLLVMQLPIGYTDLFGGSMVFMGFVGMSALVVGKNEKQAIPIIIVGLTAAMFTKYQLWVPSLLLGGITSIILIRSSMRGRMPVEITALVIVLLTLCLGFYPMRNFLLYDNPVYPIQCPILRWLPAQEFISKTDGIPPYLWESAPPIQFFHSAFELNRLYAVETYRWTYDLFAGPASNNQRMGGWFYFTVLLIALFLTFASIRRTVPRSLILIFCLIVVTMAMIPQFLNLRFTFYIPFAALFLLCLGLPYFSNLVRWSCIGLFMLAAGIVLWQLRSEWTQIDLRPPEAFAPPAARQFWQNYRTSDGTPFILKKSPYDNIPIFWSGPHFSEYPVKVP